MKIDYVISYVDGTDPAWLSEYRKYAWTGRDDAPFDVRFAPNSLFRYVFRGIDKFAPFVTGIKLLVQSESQVPVWIDRSEVDVVLHSEFIPEEYLPAFNSCTIELFMHMIPGLAEHFIYGNDDMYFLNKAELQDFFRNGKPVQSMQHVCMPADPKSYHKIFKNSSDVARIGTSVHDSTGYFKPYHVQCAMSKTFNRLTYEELEPKLLSSITRFRDPKNVCQYVYPLHALFIGASVLDNGILRFCGDIDHSESKISHILKGSRAPVCACFNSGTSSNEADLDELLSEAFPAKSSFEL